MHALLLSIIICTNKQKQVLRRVYREIPNRELIVLVCPLVSFCISSGADGEAFEVQLPHTGFTRTRDSLREHTTS